MRDFFYDPDMHGVDWPAMRKLYEPLVAHVNHRADLTYVIGEMIGELTLAMVAKQSVAILSSTIQSYPTQAEVLRKIGDAYVRSKLTPTVKKVFERWLAWRR